ncbi:MAG TPA: CHAT domain-containing protein [Flavitalea sp.]|nr:CHAT domain-containing protein [Flavitalea sp.]
MIGLLRILLLVIFTVVTETPSGQNTRHDPRYIGLFREAEKLYYANTSKNINDSIALSTYLKVIALHPAEADSILWVSNFKAGIYFQRAGRFNDAIPYFKKAISLYGKVPSITENLLYLPEFYLGDSYYSLSMLDSAVYYYKSAEDIANRHPETEGIQRLYNTLGAINYESGDYLQSKIFFEKALQLSAGKLRDNDPLVVNFKKNLALSLRQLREYDKAMSILNQLLTYNLNRDEILHNIGSIYIEQGKDSLAVAYLSKIAYNNQNKYNDLGIAYSRLDMMDSALAYFRKAAYLNDLMNASRKNMQFAITCKNLGDYYYGTENYDSALIRYQQAINQLVFDFDDADPRMNPSSFNGQYAVSELLGTLTAKAQTYTVRYQHGGNKNDLLASIFAYESLYKLADYVIRTYNSEEARVLLTNKKHLSQNEPIAISLKLFELTGDTVYLNHAFRFDEKNKAIMLSLQLQDTGSRQNADLPVTLTEAEKRLKYQVAKMQLQLADKSDSALQASLLEKQLELSDLHKKFDEYPRYNHLKFIDNTIDVKTLQKIIPEDYAVLTYHLGDTSMLAFVITRNDFRHVSHNIDSSFRFNVRKLYDWVQATDPNMKMEIDQLSDSLYRKLIEPFEDDISGIKRLMIIPDDELLLLPYEILRPLNKKSLVESYSITYNYSCSLLKAEKENNRRSSVLAMAPFVKTLRASEKEIGSIKGDKIIGINATKEKFIASAGDYSIIHLATHATTNDSVPSGSFIKFYPHDSSLTSSRMLINEIAGLTLNNVHLVILSACEKGTGKFVNGEGLMSLTRAFSFAGCQNTIASLWRADDVSTATICGHMHKYISKGKTFAASLQQAKIDYLNDDLPLRLKSPAYWAHLRLTGNFEEDQTFGYGYVFLIAGLMVIIAVVIYFSRRRS